MDPQTVTVDRSQSPARFTFSPGFNVAVAFVDRHLAEGRGAKVAIRSAAGDVTYAELAERVNRCGNALLGLGVHRGDRLLMVVKDCPEFFYLFWGAIKAGIIPIPLNTLLRADDYRYIIEDSRCAALVWSTEFEGEVKAALAAARPKPAVALPVEGGERNVRVGDLPRVRRAPRGPGRRDRRVLLALLLGIHRPAEGRRPPAPRHGGDEPALRRRRARGPRGRRLLLRREAVLRLRPRQRDDLPAVGRRDGRAPRRQAVPADHLRDHRALPPHALLRGPDALRGPAAGAREGAPGPVVGAPVRVGGRGAAGGHVPALEGAHRAHDPRRDRLDGGAPHLPVEPGRRRAPGIERARRAGVRGPHRHRRGRGPRERARTAPREGALDGGLLLEQPAEDRGDDARGRLARHRRHVRARRGGLLPLLRAERRHAEGGRDSGARPSRSRAGSSATRRCSRWRSSARRTRAGS